MENAEIRRILESKIIRLRACKKPLNQEALEEYYRCLLRLSNLDRVHTLMQDRIYTASYGDIVNFTIEFANYISPLLNRTGKKIYIDSVLQQRTSIMFSPRLTEIALGCMLSAFLVYNQCATISLLSREFDIVICASGEHIYRKATLFSCIQKIVTLHGGRSIIEFCSNFNEIALTFPLTPQFQPLKLVPCSPELCRLCYI